MAPDTTRNYCTLSTPDHQSPGLFTSVLLIPLTQVPVLVVWVSDGSLYINALNKPPFTLWCEIYESFVYKAPYSSQKRGKREKAARLDFFQIKSCLSTARSYFSGTGFRRVLYRIFKGPSLISTDGFISSYLIVT